MNLKYLKYIRYIKFAAAIILFAFLFGRIWYVYGYEDGLAVGYRYNFLHNDFVESIEFFYIWAAYALIYVIICVFQGRDETSLGTNIFSTAFLGIPFIAVLVIWIVYADTVIVSDILALIAFGIALALEIVILILHIRQDVIISKKFKKTSSI